MKLVIGRILEGIGDKGFSVSIRRDGTSYTVIDDRLLDIKRDLVRMIEIKYQDMVVEVKRGDGEE